MIPLILTFSSGLLLGLVCRFPTHVSEDRFEVEVCDTCGRHVWDVLHATGRCQNDSTHWVVVAPIKRAAANHIVQED